jgi:hypothetical protein
MTKQLKIVALALIGAIGLSLSAPTAAHASKKGKRNTAIALGAVAAYGLVKKKPLIAGLAGAGAVYSWLQSNKDDDNDNNRRRNRNRRARYQNGYYDGARSRANYNTPYYGNGGYRNYSNGYNPYQSNGYRSNSYRSNGYRSANYDSGRYRSSGHPGRGHAYGRSKRCR